MHNLGFHTLVYFYFVNADYVSRVERLVHRQALEIKMPCGCFYLSVHAREVQGTGLFPALNYDWS